MPCETGRTKGRVLSNIICIWIVCSGFSGNDFSWQRMPDGIRENCVRGVVSVEGQAPGVIAATDRAVYRSPSGGTAFQTVAAFEAGDTRVYSLYQDGSWVAAATAQGLWESDDGGVHWKKTFDPAQALHRRCYAVFKIGGTVFVGTAQGLFRHNDSPAGWYRHKGELGRRPVFAIAGNARAVMFATDDGVYRETADPAGGEAQGAVKVFDGIGREQMAQEDAESAEGYEDEYDRRFIRAVAYDDRSKIFLIASAAGLRLINESGEDLEAFISAGLPLADVEKIFCCGDCLTSHGQWASDFQDLDGPPEPGPVLFTATGRGVFAFWQDRWVALYQGLSTSLVYDLTADVDGRILAATAQGLFFLRKNSMPVLNYQDAQKSFAHEPSVQDVHEMVTAYADVNKDKIDRWKRQARVRAFVPEVSLGLDRDATDLYHWDTGSSPDELQKGDEMVAWDVALQWDLADVIWSSDQTSIDSRSKMMVELRGDLLDQATRLYFERRRLQIERAQIPEGDPSAWQAEMRIDELTAMLDAMTGRAFSRQLQMTNDKIQMNR